MNSVLYRLTTSCGPTFIKPCPKGNIFRETTLVVETTAKQMIRALPNGTAEFHCARLEMCWPPNDSAQAGAAPWLAQASALAFTLLDLALSFADFASKAFRFRSGFHLQYLAKFEPLAQKPGLLFEENHAFTQGRDLFVGFWLQRLARGASGSSFDLPRDFRVVWHFA